MKEKLKLYRNFFELLDERSELKLFKKYLMELLELAESQAKEIERLKGSNTSSNSDRLPSLEGRGTRRKW